MRFAILLVFAAFSPFVRDLQAEVLTYRFTGDLPAYRFSGWRIGPPCTTRARVEGTFQVGLDRNSGVGSLISLDARLVDSEGLFGSGLWQPYGSERDFLVAEPRYDRFRPPFEGELAPADYRPLGPDTLANTHSQMFTGVSLVNIPAPVGSWLLQDVGFEPAPADSWSLIFNGQIPHPDGRIVSLVSPYDIYFEGTEAFLTYTIPIMDAWQTISAARATLIPEPSGLCLLLLGLWALCQRELIHNRIRQQFDSALSVVLRT
jgi:hypothetical protein